MDLNETKKIVDFMKENGVCELEYTVKGSTIKLCLTPSAMTAAPASPVQETKAALPFTETESDEPGLRDVTAYTAEAEGAPAAESHMEKPSAVEVAAVAASSMKRRASNAVGAVTGLFKRRSAPVAPVHVDEEEDATELDLMEEHEETIKAEKPALRGPRAVAAFLKSHREAAAHATASLQDNGMVVDEQPEAPLENVEEAAPVAAETEAPAVEEPEVVSAEETPVEEPAEETVAEVAAEELPTEETPVEEPTEETVAEVAAEETTEEVPAEEVEEAPAPTAEQKPVKRRGRLRNLLAGFRRKKEAPSVTEETKEATTEEEPLPEMGAEFDAEPETVEEAPAAEPEETFEAAVEETPVVSEEAAAEILAEATVEEEPVVESVEEVAAVEPAAEEEPVVNVIEETVAAVVETAAEVVEDAAETLEPAAEFENETEAVEEEKSAEDALFDIVG
ncbi:MAG: hypothetical protein MJ077_02175 [Oscillospiraceae bacterium]|nr:hypothetical protein [Oscillospiraceae bacterium]